MTVPLEYEQASVKFYDYLLDARNTSDLWSTHVTYTMTQSIFQVFRRRLSFQEGIAFADILPVCLKALFVTDWNVDEERKLFEDRDKMSLEVKQLRVAHNFSPENAIKCVAQALRRHINEEALNEFLSKLPLGAVDFWEP
tara:strand:- start:63 stop:482 length:420 start_codon:yes stop_codon:yes gene_type:complete